jgi:hypothetical protein
MQQQNNVLTNEAIGLQAHDAHLPDLRPNDGSGRREWLKNIMMGSVGLGLFGMALPSFGEEKNLTACPRILRFSKDLTADIGGYQCGTCVCKDQKVYSITIVFKGVLASNRICDEAVQLIPERTIMTGQVNLTLRAAKCPDTGRANLVGCHEGKYDLIDPRSVKLFSGAFSGTWGVDHRATGVARCCWPNGEGALRGSGIDNLKDCSICSTYLLAIPLNLTEPCAKPTRPLTMRIDGSVMCPC